MSKQLSLFKRRTELIPIGGRGIEAINVSAKSIVAAELGQTSLQAKSSITSAALRKPHIFLRERANLLTAINNVAEFTTTALMNGGGGDVTISGTAGLGLQFLLGWATVNAADELQNGTDLRIGDPALNSGIFAAGSRVNSDVVLALAANLRLEIASAIGKVLDPEFKIADKQANSKLSRAQI